MIEKGGTELDMLQKWSNQKNQQKPKQNKKEPPKNPKQVRKN